MTKRLKANIVFVVGMMMMVLAFAHKNRDNIARELGINEPTKEDRWAATEYIAITTNTMAKVRDLDCDVTWHIGHNDVFTGGYLYCTESSDGEIMCYVDDTDLTARWRDYD